MITEARVILDCRVHDPQALYDAARQRYRADGGKGAVLGMLGSRRSPDICGCLQMLLDPGSSPAPEAFDIEESSAEGIYADAG